MAGVIAEDTSGYDVVSEKIASTINGAFQKLLKDLIEGGNFALLDGDEVSLTQVDLENFLAVLGGANLNIDFTPKLVKGTIARFSATDLTSSPALLGGSVSVSIGGSWSF